MNRKNCWEIKNCGRQMGGDKVRDLGECPTSSCSNAHGLNKGINGGRSCWAIAGTFCKGEVQGQFASKIKGCAGCDFFHQVADEEDRKLVKVQEILERLDN